MTGSSVVILGGLLIGVFLFVVAILVWQEARRDGDDPQPVYVVDDAVDYIVARLGDDVVRRLRRAGVRRVVEWEVHYLQGLAQDKRSTRVDVVAGGTGASVDYIQSQIAEINGVTYDRDDVAAVLRVEADYLVGLGIVGSVVDDAELNDPQSEEGDAP